MSEPNFFIFYVRDLNTSCAFYEQIFERPVQRSSDHFAMLKFSHINFALWTAQQVDPTLNAPGGSTEMVITLTSTADVDQLYQKWTADGINITQPPTQLGFGYNFVARDPDGHFLRVMA
ncbi:VOC family protein [Gynuella sunshinyii]|uniref:Putative lactoylglutathione lyase n=1 Tax=Gynuella sunshinyii YC6258 TaxID=1445510 RepID=A0A0C5UXS6_9GAMM|nr:VOC family protein [Gynuella sunshinyii]AJQ92115.1 putative lactoylglutathione lyase [Gynuella sunshinyii YC6258]